MEIKNIFENIPEANLMERFETLFTDKGFKLERIISEGQATPPGQWYDQDWDEWVVLLKGDAGILFEGDETIGTLKPGDYVYIPAHKKHRVEWTKPHEKTIWLAIHIHNEVRSEKTEDRGKRTEDRGQKKKQR
jgi:cupin 2 domain-containing protein